MNRVEIRALLDAPHWPDDQALATILGSLLRRRPMALPLTPPDPSTLWPVSSFGLDGVTSFLEAGGERQRAIVRRCASDRLREALFVEKLGLAFCAKMTLLATTVEERMLYALTAADEATHFHWISRFVEGSPRPSPFLALIGEWIEQGSQNVLTVLVQVVLEGWGVQHYRLLSRDCREESLSAALREIAVDEARHHGSGLHLLAQRSITGADREEIVFELERLLGMVRSGPQAVVAAIAPSDEEEALRCFQELDAEGDSRRKLGVVRDLIEDVEIVRDLERRGAFVPMTAEESARCSIS